MPNVHPLPAYAFQVEINGMTFPFKSCTGLKTERAVVEVEEGGFNQGTRKLMGGTKIPNIVLKQGFCTPNSELYKLRQAFMSDLPDTAGVTTNMGWKTPKRFSGTITQLGPNGTVCKWVFARAWITKWEGPDLDASKNEIAIESVEIAHSGLVMVDPTSPPASKQQQQPPKPASPPTNVNVTFPTGSSSVPSPNPALDSVANDIKNDPNKRVKVEGHTDNVGSASSNKTLSQQRADSVKDYLINQGTPPAQIVSSVGYGEEQPIADNSTAAGRSQNRRVLVLDA
jgi:phage tail-like protein